MRVLPFSRLRWAAVLVAVALAPVGCASTGAGDTAMLKVTVREVGGPLGPSGIEPNQPVPNAEVRVAATGTSLSATTNQAGVATFHLAEGVYFVSVPTCGPTGNREVRVSQARTTALTWICPIP
jgi:hypothetical protein